MSSKQNIQKGEELVAELKKKHGNVFIVTADDGATCYLRKPTRAELGLATKLGMQNPMAVNESLLNSCFVGGDECFKHDDDYFLAVSSVIDQLIVTKKVELKKA